jgi:hypothetical protein
MEISIGSAAGFTAEELVTFNVAMGLANRVLQSEEFKKAVLSHVVVMCEKPRKEYLGFVDTVLTNIQVYNRMQSADGKIKVSIETPPWYKRWFSKEIARENSNGSITIKRSYFQQAPIPELVNTIIHEVAHKAGFTHAFYLNYFRQFSVPYALGEIAEKLSLGVMLTPVPTKEPATV